MFPTRSITNQINARTTEAITAECRPTAGDDSSSLASCASSSRDRGTVRRSVGRYDTAIEGARAGAVAPCRSRDARTSTTDATDERFAAVLRCARADRRRDHNALVEVQIRQARVDDAPDVAALHLRTALFAYASIFPPEAAPPELHHLMLDWEQRLAGGHVPNLRGFVAVTGDQISGVILAGADPERLEMGHITRFYVDAPQWGQGIGRLLYEAAVSHLMRAGYRQASLWVLEENARARAWYERLGWTCTGEHKVAEGTPGVDDVRYTRSL